jgi:hypothetical protein
MLAECYHISYVVDRCTEQVHLLGVAPDSRTKSLQELILESI